VTGKLRVALLTREYPPEVYGGAGVHVEYLARELRAFEDKAVCGQVVEQFAQAAREGIGKGAETIIPAGGIVMAILAFAGVHQVDGVPIVNGLIALTKSLGKELAAHDILVNAVTPAAAKTAIFDQLTQQHIDFMLSKIPKNRFVLVEELAAMVAWLASEDCAFSTGAVFDISGGRATY